MFSQEQWVHYFAMHDVLSTYHNLHQINPLQIQKAIKSDAYQNKYTGCLLCACTKSTGCICAISRQTSTQVACPFDNLSAGNWKQLSSPYWLQRCGHSVWWGYKAIAWSVSLMRVGLMSLTVSSLTHCQTAYLVFPRG